MCIVSAVVGFVAARLIFGRVKIVQVPARDLVRLGRRLVARNLVERKLVARRPARGIFDTDQLEYERTVEVVFEQYLLVEHQPPAECDAPCCAPALPASAPDILAVERQIDEEIARTDRQKVLNEPDPTQPLSKCAEHPLCLVTATRGGEPLHIPVTTSDHSVHVVNRLTVSGCEQCLLHARQLADRTTAV